MNVSLNMFTKLLLLLVMLLIINLPYTSSFMIRMHTCPPQTPFRSRFPFLLPSSSSSSDPNSSSSSSPKKSLEFLKKKGLIRPLINDTRNVGVDEGPGGVTRGNNIIKKEERERRNYVEEEEEEEE